jgi:decaprenylphospho-beta-D-ribofuranose 2-oxidase
VPDAEIATLREILTAFSSKGVPSFLTVLKRFGAGNQSPLSFPMAGWTLALDIPTGVENLARMLDWADGKVCAVGGRIYLAKDARAKADAVAQMYPRIALFREVRATMDPAHRFASDQSRRLQLS